MRRLVLVWMVALMLLAALPAQAVYRPEIDGALDWLLTQQQKDGGITSGFAEGSDLGATVETVLAAVAAGQNPLAWPVSPLPYLEAQAQEAKDASALSRLVFAALALNQDPTDFGGVNLIAALQKSQDPGTGLFGNSLYAHAYALLALYNAGAGLPSESVQALLDQQQENGGWAMLGGFEKDSADSNTTALAAQVLVAADEPGAGRQALAYLHTIQNEDGGFPWQNPSPYGIDTDANSTALVLQTLAAVGEALDTWTPKDQSPRDALLALWDKDSGAYNWQLAMPGPNVLATAQAVQALAGMSLTQIPRVGNVVVIAMAENSEPATVVLPQAGGPAFNLTLIWVGLVSLIAGLLLRRRALRA